MKKILSIILVLASFHSIGQNHYTGSNVHRYPVKYSQNVGSLFDTRSLVDKGYVDSVKATITSGFANPMTTTGDLIYSSSGSTPARRGIGTTGQVLTVVGGVPTWANPAVTTEAEYIDFTGTDISESPEGTWTRTGSSRPLHTTQTLAASTDGSIQMKYESSSNVGAVLGFSTGATPADFGSLKYGVYVSSGAYQKIVNGSITTTGASATTGEHVRINRIGNTLTIDVSPNGTSGWTTIHTFVETSTALLYPAMDMSASSVVATEVKGVNLTGGSGGGSGNTLTNVGGEAEIVKTLSGGNYDIRTIKAGANMTVIQNANTIEIQNGITNNNQIGNGAGYITTSTYTVNGTVSASSNYTATTTGLFKLPVLTVARQFALPTASSYPGQTIILINSNNNGAALWTIQPTTVRKPDGTYISAIANGSSMTLVSDGTDWNVVATYQ